MADLSTKFMGLSLKNPIIAGSSGLSGSVKGVKELEEGDTPLEKSLSTFEEGVRLSRLGAQRLNEAERRIEILLSSEDGVETHPLDKEPDTQ